MESDPNEVALRAAGFGVLSRLRCPKWFISSASELAGRAGERRFRQYPIRLDRFPARYREPFPGHRKCPDHPKCRDPLSYQVLPKIPVRRMTLANCRAPIQNCRAPIRSRNWALIRSRTIPSYRNERNRIRMNRNLRSGTIPSYPSENLIRTNLTNQRNLKTRSAIQTRNHADPDAVQASDRVVVPASALVADRVSDQAEDPVSAPDGDLAEGPDVVPAEAQGAVRGVGQDEALAAAPVLDRVVDQVVARAVDQVEDLAGGPVAVLAAGRVAVLAAGRDKVLAAGRDGVLAAGRDKVLAVEDKAPDSRAPHMDTDLPGTEDKAGMAGKEDMADRADKVNLRPHNSREGKEGLVDKVRREDKGAGAPFGSPRTWRPLWFEPGSRGKLNPDLKAAEV